MKSITKLFTLSFILLSFSSVNIFAQDADLEFEAAESSSESSLTMRAGIYFGYTPVIGQMKEVTSGNIGGGAVFEADFLPFLGAGITAGGNFNPLSTDKLSSLWNLQCSAKIYGRFELFSGFFIQPELAYGVFAYFPKKAPDSYGKLDSCYADQFVQLAASVRYSPEALMNGLMEFELCPYYILSPEAGNINHFAGGRIGILFNF